MSLHFRTLLRITAMVVLCLSASGATAFAETRIALLIGNSGYQSVPSLPNPRNDVEDLGSALENAGFQVELKHDLDLTGMLRALQEFSGRSRTADIAVIYYAGHGIEINRQNYLIPVSAALKADVDVEFETVPLDRALAAVEGARKLSLVIVDACRDNPFLARIEAASPSRSIGRGLAAMEPQGNTLVAYSAKEGTTASDGGGRNSPYAAALIELIGQPGIEVGMFFRQVRDRVVAETGGAQEPFLYGSLSAQAIYLHAAAPVPDADVPDAPAPGGNSAEVAFWESIADSRDPQDFQDYLVRFPDGVFAPLAKRRAAAYAQSETTGGVDRDASPAPVPTSAPKPLLGETDAVTSRPFLATKMAARDIQFQLNALGFDVGTPDGIVGRRTRDAIQQFRDANGLPAAGGVDADLAAALLSRISVDRARLAWAAREAAPTPTETYCLVTTDGAVSDGLYGRPTMCHLVIHKSETEITLVTWFEYLRLKDEAAVFPVETPLSALGGGFFLGRGDIEVVLADDILFVAGVPYRRSN